MPSVVPVVVGCGRSGTTLLRAMLDSHPALAVPGEAPFVTYLARRRRHYESPAGLDVARIVRDLERKAGMRAFLSQWDLEPIGVGRLLSAPPPPPTVADGVRRLFADYARRQGKPRYGDKTPGHVSHLPMLADLFPEARFVHLIRDGRNVALSYREAPFGPSHVGRLARHWAEQVGAGRRAGALLGSGRYLEVHYEDLVTEPDATLRRICSFVDLDYDPVMVRYFERADQVLANLREREAHTRIAEPLSSSARDWEREMDPGDVALFEAIAGRWLEELGYGRVSGAPSWRSRGRVAATSLGEAAQRVRHLARRLRRAARRLVRTGR